MVEIFAARLMISFEWDKVALVSADDINLFVENIHILRKNTETLLPGSKKIGREVNTEKTKHILKKNTETLLPGSMKIGLEVNTEKT